MASDRSNHQMHHGGFTLIELLIVVAIVGILAQIAIPSYSGFIAKQRRSDAHHLLRSNAQILQRCLTLRGAYNNGCNLVAVSREGYYELSSTLAVHTYRLAATPASNGPQSKDGACTSLVLTQSGVKSATGTDSGSCW